MQGTQRRILGFKGNHVVMTHAFPLHNYPAIILSVFVFVISSTFTTWKKESNKVKKSHFAITRYECILAYRGQLFLIISISVTHGNRQIKWLMSIVSKWSRLESFPDWEMQIWTSFLNFAQRHMETRMSVWVHPCTEAGNSGFFVESPPKTHGLKGSPNF